MHSENSLVFNADYLDFIESLLHSSFCSQSVIAVKISNCNDLLNRISEFGYKSIFSEYLEFLHKAVKLNKSKKEPKEIFRDEIFETLDILNYNFIRNSMSVWIDKMGEVIKNRIYDQSNVKTIIFAIILVFYGLGFLTIWLPFVFQLRDNVVLF